LKLPANIHNSPVVKGLDTTYKELKHYLTVKGKDIPIRDIFEEALNLQVGWENNTVIIK